MEQELPLTAQVAEQHRAFAAAISRHDARSAADAYAEDARLLPPLVDLVEGRDEICAFWQAGVDSGISSIQADTIDCRQVEDLAYELGRYSLSIESESLRVVERGRYVTVHRRVGGRWLRAVEMFTSDGTTREDQ